MDLIIYRKEELAFKGCQVGRVTGRSTRDNILYSCRSGIGRSGGIQLKILVMRRLVGNKIQGTVNHRHKTDLSIDRKSGGKGKGGVGG